MDLRAVVHDAGYVAVGLGVLGVQRAKVRRHQIEQRLFAVVPRQQLESILGESRRFLDEGVDAVGTELGRTVEAAKQVADKLASRARAT